MPRRTPPAPLLVHRLAPLRAMRLAPLLAVLLLAQAPRPAGSAEPEAWRPQARRTPGPGDLRFLGEARLAPGTTFQGTVVGGLSGLCYDPCCDRYLAVCDDRSQTNPARVYTLRIHLRAGRLELAVEGVTTLTTCQGTPFPARSLDPEGIALARDRRTFFVSSEGDPRIGQAPWIKAFGRDGRERRSFALPERYLPPDRPDAPGGPRGVRVNQGFEALTLTPDGRTLVTAVENALAQDGPEAGPAAGSRCRVLSLDVATGRPLREQVYDTEPVPRPSTVPGGGADNGLPELLALDDAGTFLALERSYAAGVGVTARLFAVDLFAATDTSHVPALADADGDLLPVAATAVKRLLLDVGTLRGPDGAAVVPDNLEALCLGPALPDGARLLLLLSDDNFNPQQVTQVLAFALRLPAPERSRGACR